LQNSIRAGPLVAIVILGIAPDRPETGFGYIKREGVAGRYQEFNVSNFAEKPDLETAKGYIASNDYSWNGGMFVVRASRWLEALEHFNPAILA
jgi:mannose-1-phosphate guanylyltransferase/mannose-6-phosphate isomerase